PATIALIPIINYDEKQPLSKRGFQITCLNSRFSFLIPYHILWTIAIVLIVLWLLGIITSYTIGGFIHILLMIAIIVVLVRLIKGQKIL
ncbi:hypothetical protein COW94_04925, partial [Candidatus Peregrinibacteria bacterium CG22_combo_CG10-13_8_21_14_all_44_10]